MLIRFVAEAILAGYDDLDELDINVTRAGTGRSSRPEIVRLRQLCRRARSCRWCALSRSACRALSLRLARGDDLAAAARFAARVGAAAVRKPGAQSSFPTLEDL